MAMEEISPGIWKVTFGQPEAHTPVRLRHREAAGDRLRQMPSVPCPFKADDILYQATARGSVVSLPLGKQEQLYGLGLQLKSHNQRGKKKTLRVNSDPTLDMGDSHAPVPFYVSTAGYGVFVDTARYATFYMGCTYARSGPLARRGGGPASDAPARSGPAMSAEELYRTAQVYKDFDVVVEVPFASGVDIYVFAGPTMLDAIARYNLFSGGGCVPPRWGLGVWYRCLGSMTQEQALNLAGSLRADRMPCDVYGLEPGWQSASYSCTWAWNKNFPDPRAMAGELTGMNLRLNLWTHAFAQRSNELYDELAPLSGTHEVWNGLVPDLTLPKVRDLISRQHERTHVDLGVSGYKLDECDNSDFINVPWSFGEISQFPSGLDGEQFHSLMGVNYQETIESIFRRRDQRTYGQVRNSHALAANYPFVLYSDLYDHRDYIRGLVNTGFSGLLWSPEVRDATSAEDLIRRLQTVVLSPQAVINAWYIKNPPWKQWRTKENNADQFLPDSDPLSSACRTILEFRMRLLPYLHAAFYDYHLRGVPPFRALVADWPQDAATHNIADQWMIGDRLMAAPVLAGQARREVYLPAGTWRDFWTGQVHAGPAKIEMDVPLDMVPLFVKDNSLLPLARPTLHTEDAASLEIIVQVFGDGQSPFTLYEDDGQTYGYEHGRFNRLQLAYTAASAAGTARRTGSGDFPQYRVVEWLRR